MSRAMRVPQFGQRVWSILLLLVLCSWALAISAEETERQAAGRVLVTAGTVEAVATDGTTRKLRRRARVYAGETVRTGTRGRTQIRFTDGALLSLRPDTQIKVDEYQFTGNDTTDRKSLSLTTGSIRTVTGRIGRVNRAAYRVATPLAVIGIRGTDWEALQQPNGPLLLGVNDGGITAQSTTGNEAEIGVGTNFNYAQVNPDGNLQLLPEPPAALVEAGAVDEAAAAEEGDSGSGESEGGGEEGGDGEAASEGEGGDLETDAAAAPPPPSGGGESSGGADSGGGDGLVSTAQPAAPPPPSVNINPSEQGEGTPPTTQPLERVLTEAESQAIITGNQVALVAGMRTAATGNSQVLLGLVGPDDDDVPASFNFAFGSFTTPPTDRAAALNAANRLVKRDGVAFTGRADNVGGVSGLTFGRYDASTTTPLRVFTDPALSTSAFDLTTPFVFALFSPANVANLTGRLRYTPANSLVAVSTGTVSTLVSDIVLDVNLGNGAIERGVLDIGFGATADALVFLSDFDGNINNGLLNAVISDIVLQDNGANQTFAARGTLRGAFTGTGTIPALVLSFDFADTAGRNQFARGVVQYTGATAPLPPSLALSATELQQLSTGFYFIGANSSVDTGVASGRASNAMDTLGRPVFGQTVDPDGGSAEPGDANFGVLPPTQVIRQAGAPTAGFVSSIATAGFETVSYGRWLGSPAAQIELRDAANGSLLDSADDTVFWITFQPKPIANLSGQALFSTGPGAVLDGAFTAANGTRLPLLDARASVFVDFNGAAIFEGSLFVTTERNGGDDLGFDVQFTGTVAPSNGGAFASLTPTGGAYRGNRELGLSTELVGAFTGTGANTGLLLAFHLEEDGLTQAVDSASGLLALSQTVEQRFTAADAGAFNRLGIALYAPLDARGNLTTALPSGIAEGILVGRSAAVGSAGPGGFLIAANDVGSLDSARLLADPASFVLRRDTAFETNVDTQVGDPLSGIGWGVWQTSSDGPPVGAAAFTDPANGAARVVFDRDVLFASLIPTQVGNITGVATYTGITGDSLNPSELLAFGGPLSGGGIAFDEGVLGVAVDFNSGALSGSLFVRSNQVDVEFDGDFTGRLTRNVAELTFTLLDVSVSGNTVAGDLNNSSGISVITGPTGGQVVTGFQLIGNGHHVEGFITANKMPP